MCVQPAHAQTSHQCCTQGLDDIRRSWAGGSAGSGEKRIRTTCQIAAPSHGVVVTESLADSQFGESLRQVVDA